MTLAVACVLRSGGDYDIDYIDRLQHDLKRHTPDAELICLSDVPVPCARIPLKHDWPGWWAKIELFRAIEGPVLYIDLDTLVMGDVSPLMDYEHTFTALPNYLNRVGFGSGVMAWGGDLSRLYETFREKPEAWMHACKTRQCWGDQGFIARHITAECWDDTHPGLIQSAKIKADRSRARLICFHGKPRPRDVGWRVPE